MPPLLRHFRPSSEGPNYTKLRGLLPAISVPEGAQWTAPAHQEFSLGELGQSVAILGDAVSNYNCGYVFRICRAIASPLLMPRNYPKFGGGVLSFDWRLQRPRLEC